MGKKGISDVVVTVLLILIVIAAIAIVWVFVAPLLRDSASSIGTSLFTTSLEIAPNSLQVQGEVISLRVTRKAGEGDVIGVNVLVEDSGQNSKVFRNDTRINELETKVISVNIFGSGLNSANIVRVSISPIILQNDREVEAGIADSEEVGTAQQQAPLSCGNGSVDAGEQCDGANLNGQTCTSLGQGFTGGTLSCSSCQFDTSACISPQPLSCDFNSNWTLNFIEQGGSSAGADGTDLADIDGDGDLDITTYWEQGGFVKVYKNPSNSGSWQMINVASGIPNGEDAHFVDLDNDGLMDIVTAHEVGNQKVYVHWGQSTSSWGQTGFLTNLTGKSFLVSGHGDVNGDGNVDIIVGMKGPPSPLDAYWFKNPGPANVRNLSAWTAYKIGGVGYTMSLIPTDIDGDGDLDVLMSDRIRGVIWRENPGPASVTGTWTQWVISGVANQPDGQVRWCEYTNFDNDGLKDVVCALSNNTNPSKPVVSWFKNPGQASVKSAWPRKNIQIDQPTYNQKESKAVAVGDLNNDGKKDIAIVNGEFNDGDYAYWISYPNSIDDPIWNAHLILSQTGTKYDEVQLIDVDQNGFLDVITSEENQLGVVWFSCDLQ